MSLSKSNILLIVQHLSSGGTEHSVAKLSSELDKYYNVLIATFVSEKEHPTTFQYSGKIISLNENSKLSTLLKLYRRYNFIKNLKKEHNINCSISFLQSADIINALTNNSDHTTILSVRTDLTKLLEPVKSKLFYNYIFKNVDKYHVQNESNFKNLSNYISTEKIKIIPNFFDTSNIRSKANDKHIFSSKSGYFIIVITGTLYYVKGQKHIFKILSELKKEGINNIKLILQGDPLELKDYIEYSKKLNLKLQSIDDLKNLNLDTADIFNLGFQNNPYAIVKHADISVLSSYHEGSPNVLVESMICGTPVMSTDCPVGPRELLMDKPDQTLSNRGILLPKFDKSSLKHEALSQSEQIWKHTIIDILNKKINLDSLAKNASEYVEQYDSKHIIKHWKSLIEK